MSTPADPADVVAFVRARYDDDERQATNHGRLAGDVWTAMEVAPGRWEVIGAGRGVVAAGLTQWEAEHIARHDPAWVLADLESKRRLLDWLARRDDWATDNNLWTWDSTEALLLLALPFAAHPDYRPEWRPA